MINDLMSIRAMCDAFDVTARTLRFYEAKELLFPIREGQKRLFTPRDRARLKLILRGKQFGFSLEEMRQLLNLYDGEDGEMAQLRKCMEISAVHLQKMQKRKSQLDATITELRAGMDKAVDTLAAMRADRRAVDSNSCSGLTANAINIQPSDRTAARKFARL